MSFLTSGPTSLATRQAPREWQALCRACLPTLSSPTTTTTTTTTTRPLSTTPRHHLTPRERAFGRRDEASDTQNRAMERNITRDWKTGDVYAPHDLSAAEMRKWRKREAPKFDAFDALNLDPTDFYRNFAVMSEYVTEMGRIKHSKVTGLRWTNQRKIAKAIRRAIGLGLMPSVHRHPEVLRVELRRSNQGSIN